MRVVIDEVYPSKPVIVTAPQISVQVPATVLVTVGGTGKCTVSSGSIKNNSKVPIYLTDVTFTWSTSRGTNDNGTETPAPSEIFTNWDANSFDSRPQMTLAVGENTATAGTANEAENSITWTPSAATGKMDAATDDDHPGTLPLTWSFDLKSNAISTALQADVAAPIGVITYMVSYQKP